MDLEDEGWVSVPYDELLEAHNDGDEKIFSRKHVKSPTKFYNHFNTSHTSYDHVEDDFMFEKQFDHKEEIIKLPILITEPKETSFEPHEHNPESNQDPIFQVFFKKENQFDEMKMGSPRLSSQELDLSRTDTCPFQYEKKNDDHVVNCSSSNMIKKEVVTCKESNQTLNFWKWGLNGIGVFCSLGMAAATICIIVCGNGTRHKQQNQKLKFQIYPDNKRIKQVVQKANEAISTVRVRGVPLVNAQITSGGHYECL